MSEQTPYEIINERISIEGLVLDDKDTSLENKAIAHGLLQMMVQNEQLKQLTSIADSLKILAVRSETLHPTCLDCSCLVPKNLDPDVECSDTECGWNVQPNDDGTCGMKDHETPDE